MIRAVLHLTNDQPLAVELLEMPTPSDIAVVCTNVRTIDGKKPTFVDYPSSTFVFPMAGIRFVEVLQGADEAARSAAQLASLSAPADDSDDLEIDEDFLRRVREA